MLPPVLKSKLATAHLQMATLFIIHANFPNDPPYVTAGGLSDRPKDEVGGSMRCWVVPLSHPLLLTEHITQQGRQRQTETPPSFPPSLPNYHGFEGKKKRTHRVQPASPDLTQPQRVSHVAERDMWLVVLKTTQDSIQCKPRRVYSEENPTDFNGARSQESV